MATTSSKTQAEELATKMTNSSKSEAKELATKMTSSSNTQAEDLAIKTTSSNKTPVEELEWIIAETKMSTEISKSIGSKMAINPFVPLGMMFTVTALVIGLKSFVAGDRHKSQKMMRYRIAAQGSTIFALIGGCFYEFITQKK